MAIMGNIGYPINAHQVYPNQYDNKKEHAVLNLPFNFDFNIGELEMVASREGLEYDERTIGVLRGRVSALVAEFKTIVQEKFDKCVARIDAHTLYGELFGYGNNRGSSSYHTAMVNILRHETFNWNGIQIKSENISVYSTSEPDTALVKNLDMSIKHYHMRNNRRGNKSCKEQEASEIACAGNVTRKSFYVCDLNRGSTTRIRNFLKANPNNTIYLLRFVSPDSRQKFVQKLGILDSDIVGTSTLPAPVRTPRVSNGSGTPGLLEREASEDCLTMCG